MSNARTRKELPRLKLKFTIRLATAADRRALDRFWEMLLASQSEVKNGQQKMG